MRRSRLIALVAVTLAAGGLLPTAAAAAGDAPDQCANIEVVAPKNTWLSNAVEGGSDVDWFAFQLNATRTVILTLGDVPVDLDLGLYGACGDVITTSTRNGRNYEEIQRRLSAGLYRVRVRNTGSLGSSSDYALRFHVLPENSVPVLSSRSWVTNYGYSSNQTHWVGEIVNNRPDPIATVDVHIYYIRNGSIIAGAGYNPGTDGLGPRQRLPFIIDVSAPLDYDRTEIEVTWEETPRDPADFTLSEYPPMTSPGAIEYGGWVRNDNARATRTWVHVTVYGERGQVLHAKRRLVGDMSPSEVVSWYISFGDHIEGRDRKAVAASGRRYF